MEKEKMSFRESILSRIANTLVRYQTNETPPTDSSIETRKAEMPSGNNSGNGFGATLQNAGVWYDQQMHLDPKRIAKYKDYDIMDKEDPEISSALDIYADNATKGESETDTVIEIVSKDQKVVDILDEHIKKVNLDVELWSILRELCKDGDNFEEVVVYPDGEVHRLKPLDSKKMVLVHDEWGRPDKDHPYIQKDDVNKTVAKFEDWQVIHFKMVKERTAKYGVDGSVLAPIRKLYKQLSMLEDSLVLARLTRAIQRYAYLIDTEGVDAGDPTLDYLDKVMGNMRKRRTINPATNQMDLDYNPMSMEEDVFVAVKANSRANVKVLQGSTNLGILSDVEYFRDRKFAGMKVPKAYLSHEKDVRARAMITEQDVQFARTVRRLQISATAGLRKLFNFVLMSRGIDPNKVEYEIRLPALSTIDEIRIWQVKQIKVNVAAMLHRDLKISTHWLLINILGYAEEDVQAIIAYLDDKDSLDSKLFDKAAEAQQMFAKDKDDQSDELTRKKERPKGGKVPTKKDNEDPNNKDTGKTKDNEPKESLSAETIEQLKTEIKPLVDNLVELLNWYED